ncbi:MAG: hypothetical protein K0S32_4053 [Bacteroidetes bacterium]|jgi:hypothetical protein|nr:hypothetical protein [Bacteroidota bacterium]
MKPIIRNILAVVVGLVVGSVVNMALIIAGPKLIPVPEGIDVTTAEGLAVGMHLMQPKHFIFPFLAHALGTLVGAYLATKISTGNKMRFALTIGFVFFFGGLMNCFMIPAPTWFMITDVVLAYLPFAWLAGRLGGAGKEQ